MNATETKQYELINNEINAAIFSRVLKALLPMVSPKTRPHLHRIAIEIKKASSTLHAVATDGHKLIHVEIPIKNVEQNLEQYLTVPQVKYVIAQAQFVKGALDARKALIDADVAIVKDGGLQDFPPWREVIPAAVAAWQPIDREHGVASIACDPEILADVAVCIRKCTDGKCMFPIEIVSPVAPLDPIVIRCMNHLALDGMRILALVMPVRT